MNKREYDAIYYAANRDAIKARVKARYDCKREEINAERRKDVSRYASDEAKDYHLRRKYGIGIEDKRAMIVAQGGRCAVCRHELADGRQTCVDHNHETGAVRGVLCRSCNVALGQLRDDPVIIGALLLYLQGHAPCITTP